MNLRGSVLPGGFTGRFHQVTYLLVAVATLPLFTTQVLSWAALPVVAGVGALAYLQDLGRVERRISRRAWTAVVGVAVAWTALGVLNESTRFRAFLHLLLFLQGYRLLSPKRNREYLQVYVLAFFQLLVTTSLQPNFSLAPLLLVFMIVSTWTLTAFQMKRGLDEEERFRFQRDPELRPVGAPTAVDPLVRPRTLLLTALLAIATFAATFPIFFAIPRLGTGFFLSPLVQTSLSTGFTEKVELGAVGQIGLNQAMAMRVEFAHPQDVLKLGNRHLRGIALNHYDGDSWSKLGIDDHPLDPERRGRGGAPNSFQFGRGAGGRETLEYTIYQEPLGTAVLFGFYQPFHMIVGVDSLRVDDAGTVALERIYPSAIKYIGQSYLDEPSPARLRRASTDFDADTRRHYLQLPPDLDPRVGELAERVTRGLATNYDRAMAVQRYLEENYLYTLDLVRSEELRPLEDFLFEQGKGHCEYFATAMAVMLRTLDIPTRVVNGFVRGEWNDIGEYLIVRQADAHTWVEVLFPGPGWIPMDPSPRSIAPIGDADIGTVATARHALDAVRMAWNRYVLDFSVVDQRRAIMKAYSVYYMNRRGLNPTRWLSNLRDVRGAGQSLAVVFAFGLVAFALYNLLRPGTRRVRLSGKRSRDAVIAHGFYAEMLKRLAKRGVTKPAASTPREFQRVARRLDRDSAEAVGALTTLYEEVRYGGRALSAEQKAAAEGHLKALAARRAPASPDAPAGGRPAG